MFHQLELLLLSYAEVLPLPLFAAFASMAEEIIAPIPSGPVMLLMGGIAEIQGYTLLMLAGLAVVAALGKLSGSLIIYVIADKAEDIFAARFARFFGISHKQIESFGARFGNGWKDYLLLTTLRSLPFIPSALVSVGSGVLKIPLRLYIPATFLGSIIRDSLYLYVGYIGLVAAESVLASFSAIESVVIILSGAIMLGALGLLYRRHRKKRQIRSTQATTPPQDI